MVLPLRQLMNLYVKQRDRRQQGDRVMRETSTVVAAENVWSDVASSRGLGFRSGDAGPLLYGDLASRGVLEVSLGHTNYADVYCTVATVRARAGTAKTGAVSCRPHDLGTRVLKVAVTQPGVGEELLARYFARSRPLERAKEILGERARAMLLDLFDRAPRLFWEDGTTTLVLEGVELVHERLEEMIDALTEIDRAGHGQGPGHAYRERP